MMDQFTKAHVVTTVAPRRITAAAGPAEPSAAPIFADVARFGEPSPTHRLWHASTSGLHPAFL